MANDLKLTKSEQDSADRSRVYLEACRALELALDAMRTMPPELGQGYPVALSGCGREGYQYVNWRFLTRMAELILKADRTFAKAKIDTEEMHHVFCLPVLR